MPPVAFSADVTGRETAMLMALEEESKEAYKREKASLVGFQGSFTKKEKTWGDAVEAWQQEPLSVTQKEMAEEAKAPMLEAKKRLDAALYDVINYGVVTDAYDDVMGQYDDRYEAINKKFMRLLNLFRDKYQRGEEEKLKMIKEEKAELKKERDEKLEAELEAVKAKEEVEANRVERKLKLAEAELEIVRERAAADAAARANPVPGPPVHPHAHVPVDGALQRRYREVQSLRPDTLSISQSPEELRLFQDSFRNWFNISCIDTLGLQEQLFTLKKCCDLSLQQKVNWAQPNIEAALLALTQIWIAEYPVVVRRLEYLRNKQMQSEDDEQFVLREKQLFLNADIATMTPVQLQKLKIISGLRDAKLQIKLLELPAGATLAELDTARHNYTANISTSEKLGEAFSNHKAQKVGSDTSQTCWKCGQIGHVKFDCRVKDVYCTKCKSSSHVASTCRNNDRGRSASRGRDNSRGRNASRGRDRNRNDSKNNRQDSRGRTPGHRDKSDSRRRSNSRNERHRARSVDHTETLGHEIVNRLQQQGRIMTTMTQMTVMRKDSLKDISLTIVIE